MSEGAADEIPLSQSEYLHADIHQLVRGRYGTMTVLETIGILEMVKLDLYCELHKLARIVEE